MRKLYALLNTAMVYNYLCLFLLTVAASRPFLSFGGNCLTKQSRIHPVTKHQKIKQKHEKLKEEKAPCALRIQVGVWRSS